MAWYLSASDYAALIGPTKQSKGARNTVLPAVFDRLNPNIF